MPNFHLPNFMICPSFDERFSHQLCRKCLQRKTPHTDPISDRRVWAPCPACCVEAPSPGPSSARPSKGSLKTLCPQPPSERKAELSPSVAGIMRGGEEGGEGPGLAGWHVGRESWGRVKKLWFLSLPSTRCVTSSILLSLSEAQLLHLMPEDAAAYLSWSFIHSFAGSFPP